MRSSMGLTAFRRGFGLWSAGTAFVRSSCHSMDRELIATTCSGADAPLRELLKRTLICDVDPGDALLEVQLVASWPSARGRNPIPIPHPCSVSHPWTCIDVPLITIMLFHMWTTVRRLLDRMWSCGPSEDQQSAPDGTQVEDAVGPSLRACRLRHPQSVKAEGRSHSVQAAIHVSTCCTPADGAGTTHLP